MFCGYPVVVSAFSYKFKSISASLTCIVSRRRRPLFEASEDFQLNCVVVARVVDHVVGLRRRRGDETLTRVWGQIEAQR